MPPLQDLVLDWYDAHARDLPWRSPTVSPWKVMVSEVMLQQTPVVRVLPVYEAWVERWPTPSALAGEPPGEAVRAWGRLGYPRRALRLHASAVIITGQHGGCVPSQIEELRGLPGVGEYTAAAIATFAFRQSHVVLDTNVRRVLSRALHAHDRPPLTLRQAERSAAREQLPSQPEAAARWSAAVMELGAMVCTSRKPACGSCPLARRCAWLAAGHPRGTSARPVQAYDGTDRQCRGRLLAELRAASGDVSTLVLERAWPDERQRQRSLAGLVADGLVEQRDAGAFRLPGVST